ncbi:13527_t:CDS:10 [Entrophospora sp. SA101]|nr:13527_t:CDS:10 [Entrophospora sp. SA101]
MNKKSRRNARVKYEDEDIEMQNTEVGLQTSTNKIPGSTIKTKEKTKAKVTLSFGNDEEVEGESFKITKSTASRNLTKTKIKKLVLDQLKEYLSQLRANTPSTPASFQNQDNIIAEKFPSTIGPGQIAGIPDAGIIHALKKKREMLRQKITTSAPEYISISDDETDVISTSGKQQIESRLVREEDEIGDAEEELEQYVDEKLVFGKKALKEHEKKKKSEREEMIMDVDYEDEDEGFLQWELEAIKKGTHVLQKPVEKPETKKLLDLESFQKTRQLQLQQLQKDIENHQKVKKESKLKKETAIKRYTFFQELKIFIENLTDFLDEKVVKVEIYRSIILNISLYSDMVLKTRLKYDDGLKGTTCESRRQNRESRRLKRLKNRMVLNYDDDDEGFSTDDKLSETDEEEYNSKIDQISHLHTKLLEDVIDDYKSISIVKSKFVEWKNVFDEDYRRAYGGLSLPGVFEFYIRYEILFSETFQKYAEFNKMDWYNFISEYGDTIVDSNSTNEGSDDDVKLLCRRILEKAILPRATQLINSYNPYSSKHTNFIIEFCNKILDYVDRSSPKFETFLMSISDRLQNTIKSLKIISESDFLIPQIEGPIMRARNRYFCRKYKLMRNLILWKNIISPDILRPIIIDQLLDKVILCLLISSQVDSQKYQKILEIVPEEWLSPPLLQKIALGAAGL